MVSQDFGSTQSANRITRLTEDATSRRVILREHIAYDQIEIDCCDKQNRR